MRFAILLASVIIQVCLGGLYAWSSFVPALQNAHNLSVAQTQLIFGVLIAVFTIVMVLAGRLLDRLGARLVAGIGGMLFGAGYLVAAASRGSFALLLLGIGLVAGAGTGFGYVCPLATCVKWFPAHKGLVTGIAVAGFGGGAILLSSAAEMLFARDMDVLTIFRWIGIVYGAVIVAAAAMLKAPLVSGPNRTPMSPLSSALARDRFFWSLVAGMFSGTFAGLLVVGNIKPMALSYGYPPAVAAMAISGFAAGNATGRIAWGWIADRIGARAVTFSLFTLCCGLCGLVPASATAFVYVGVSVLVGFGFGACFVVYAAQVASRYGSDHMGKTYPLVFLSYGVAGIAGPWTGGALYDTTGAYVLAIGISAGVVIAGILIRRRLLHGYLWAGNTSPQRSEA